MQLDGYSDLAELAEGGMARVYKARQLSLNRIVALKVLSAQYLWDDDAKLLFDQESLVIAQLNHPNIIHIIDRGLTEKGRPYFVMEFIQGDELTDYVKKHKLSIQEKLDLLIQVCKGMACAHKNGVIHRDIKPANILIDDNAHVYILDFGIAWLAASGRPEDIVGTPDYMSPEQFTAPETLTHLSDIYSLGVIMYELFLGKLPTAYFDDLATSMSSLPSELAKLIEECLQTEAIDRPVSADEIKLRLLKLMQGAHLNKNQKDEAAAMMGKAKSKFALLDVIKRDSFGAVYLFEDKEKHSLLVIKKRIRTIDGFKEARLLSHLHHDNIIKILGSSKNENAFIVVMEHVTGGSLQDRLSRPYSTQKFVDFAQAFCSAMSCAHKNNIIHGNLRPSNILFDDKECIKVTDFGLDEHYSSNDQMHDWYQIKDRKVNPVERDVFSAGAIFYHMLTGVPVTFVRGRIQPSFVFSRLDKQLKRLLRNILEVDLESRHRTFDEISDALKKIEPEKVEQEVASVKKVEKPKVRVGLLLSIFIFFNLFPLTLFFYFNQGYFSTVKDLFISFLQ